VLTPLAPPLGSTWYPLQLFILLVQCRTDPKWICKPTTPLVTWLGIIDVTHPIGHQAKTGQWQHQ
jgi:hypothetical protein